MTRSIVLVSGGLDSAAALWWALDRGHEVRALTFHYHDRAPAEVRATRRLAEAAGVELVEEDVPGLMEVVDMAPRPPALEGAPDAYVPHRNLVFYGFAAHHAERWSATRVVGGHIGADPDSFPDSGPAFFDALNDLLTQSRWPDAPGDLRIVNPLEGSSKAEVLELALELDVPLEATWSCGELADAPCGECPSCRERAEAFDAVGVLDPAVP